MARIKLTGDNMANGTSMISPKSPNKTRTRSTKRNTKKAAAPPVIIASQPSNKATPANIGDIAI